jgi:two-component system LytT family response regulator
MNIRCIIVDDEKPSRMVLSTFLIKYCPEVEIVGEAENTDQAQSLIETTKPDLLFLDISMPDQSGFDLLDGYGLTAPFEVIFVTAHSEYAVKAIRNNATDYLIKPLGILELKDAIGRAALRIKKKKSEQLPEQKPIDKMVIPVKDGFIYVSVAEIVRCEADAGYTWLHIKDKPKVFVSRTLGDFENNLPSDDFVRVHHHHLINIKYIAQYSQSLGGHVIMTDNATIEVSRRKKDEFLKKLGVKD